MISAYKKQLPEVFYKKGALKNFAKFTGKHLGTESQACNFIKIRDSGTVVLL